MTRIIILLFFVFLSFFSFAINAQGTTPLIGRSSFEPDLDGGRNIMPSRFLTPSYGIILAANDIQSNDASNVLSSSVKPWLTLFLQKNAFLHLRGKMATTGMLQAPPGAPKTFQNLYDLDLAFYQHQWNKVKLNLGRQFFRMGQGLFLDGQGDGLDLRINAGKNVQIHAIGLYSGLLQKISNPFNLSDRDLADGSKRAFLGAEAPINIKGHVISPFYLYQKDLSKQDVTLDLYNAHYMGLGINGPILKGKLNYVLEGGYETGQSQTLASKQTSTINAYGGDLKLTYIFKTKVKPTILLEVGYGSGDADRASAVNPVANLQGNDTGFIHMGTFQGGLGLRPRLSNLVVYSIGNTIMPLGAIKNRLFKKLQMITKLFYYSKLKTDGGINSGEAREASNDVGLGADVYLTLRLSIETSAMLGYGFFKPGTAFAASARKTRNIVMLGANLSI